MATPPDCSGKTVLSLFDYSGAWSAPYYQAGANVIQLDIKHGFDIGQLNATWFYENIFDVYGTVDGILAAPPCTNFTSSGAQYWTLKDADGRTAESLELVRQVLRCVDLCQPDWWVLENPVGRLNKLIPRLSEYGPQYFQPYDYGDPWTKKTGLWGNFNFPLPLLVGIPSTIPNSESWIMKLGGNRPKTKELRSMTPMGFAKAFFSANCWQYESD